MGVRALMARHGEIRGQKFRGAGLAHITIAPLMRATEC
jgi:hypothetical protein